MRENEISEKVIGCAIEVHRHLGPGLLESAYEEALCYELSKAGFEFKRQQSVPIKYNHRLLNDGPRAGKPDLDGRHNTISVVLVDVLFLILLVVLVLLFFLILILLGRLLGRRAPEQARL